MGNLAKGASSLVGSPALVAAMLAFTIAQICKVFTHYHTTGKVDWGRLVGSGGMPSSHTALVVGLTTAIGLKDALDSSIFALCLVFSLVVSARLVYVFRFSGVFWISFPSLLTTCVLRAKGFSRERGFLKPSSLSNSLSLSSFFVTSKINTGDVRCHRRSSPRRSTGGGFESAHRRASSRSPADG